MENAHKNDMNGLINQMQMIKFQSVFMAALDLLKKQPLLLIGLFLAPMLVNAVIQNYVMIPLQVAMPGLMGGIVVSALFGVLSAVIGLIGTGLLLRAASQVFDGKKVDLKALASFVEKHIVDAIRLAIKLFIFTGGWLMIAYMAVVALLLPIAPALSATLGLLSPIAVIVYVIVFFKKIVDASLSYAIFWSAEAPTPDGAMKKSLELAEGLSMTIFGNYLLISLIGMVISMVLMPVLLAIFAVVGSFGIQLAGAIIGGLLGTFYVLFQYCLKGQIEKFRAGGHHGTAHSA
jgi:hypothetical protein